MDRNLAKPPASGSDPTADWRAYGRQA